MRGRGRAGAWSLVNHPVALRATPLLSRRGEHCQAPPDLGEYAFEIRENVTVLEANDVYATAREVCGPLNVTHLGGFMVVRGPVKFDGEARRRAVEVEYIRAYAVLSPELSTAEPAVLKLDPETCLCGRERRAQAASDFFQLGAIVDSLKWLHRAASGPHTMRVPVAHHASHEAAFFPSSNEEGWPRPREGGARTGWSCLFEGPWESKWRTPS